ncbi:MAG TPA: BatA domain-containing protein [Planctomycetaceae bacterium]|nr:BatA domain-containing protein [Planctomycetaceae bacterium]
MSLLTPLYLLGLAAVGLPVLFHLIRRQPRGRKVFSTVMFLEPSPPRVTRRSRLENWPLLLLRAAAVCLLVLAFARPYLREILGIEQSGEAGEAIVILVDTSASMRRDGLWEDAVRRVESVIAARRPADRVAILAFDREVRPVMSLDEWAAVEPSARRHVVRERLGGLSPGWAATHLDQALVTAAELLHAASTSGPHGSAARPKRIVLVSDVAEGSRVESLANQEWPADVPVTLERVAPTSPTNAGLQLVAGIEDRAAEDARRTEVHSVRDAGGSANREAAAEAARDGTGGRSGGEHAGGRSGTPSYGAAHVRVRVTNASDSMRAQFQLAWRPPADRAVSGPRPVEVYCPAGQSRVVRVAVPDGLELPAKLTLTGDDHEFDNSVPIDQPIARTVHVLLYTDDPADDPAGMRFYLERAFHSAGRSSVRVTAQPADAPGPVPVSRDVPLVIVGTPPADEQFAGLRHYMQQGGTLLIAAETTAACTLWGRLFDGAAVEAREADVAGYAMLTGIDFSHPLFAPFNEPRFADFTGVRIWRHRRVALDVSAATQPKLEASATSGGPRVLARLEDGSPAMIEQPLGRGRGLLMAFGWHPADSQLALSTKFVPLVHALVVLAAGEDDGPRRLVVGDPLPLASRRGETAAPVTIRTPDAGVIQLAADSAMFPAAAVPGVYRISSEAGDERRFTVGLPPEESRTAPMPLERLESLGVRLASTESPEAATSRAARERQLKTEELETRQKYWRWLIVAALGVLVLETWLGGRLARGTRRSSVPELNRI